MLCLTLGAAGAILPLLPTTPFALLAAYAFARSSPRLHNWIISHAHFGPLITNWQQQGAIARRAKVGAGIVLLATPIITWAMGAPVWALAAQGVILLGVGVFIFTRPEPGFTRPEPGPSNPEKT